MNTGLNPFFAAAIVLRACWKTQTGVALASWMLLAASASAQAPASPPGAGGVQQVIVVFKTHFDIGYTDMASNVVQRYRTTMIDDALKVVEQNRTLPPEQQFAWTLPGWPMTKITEDWPGQTPERKQRIMQAFKDGRFVVHALPFSMHTETLELEDLARGLGCASRLARAVSLPLPRDAKMTDVPCHSWILPTLLRNAGVEFLHLGCNSASSSPEVPLLFFWEGPDGSRLLTMYSAGGYGTGLVPPTNWTHQTWLALIHTGDNHGPPTPAEVKSLLEDAAKKLPGVKVRIGRLSDFGDAILAEKYDIPVVRGDMPDTWIHGPMSDPQGARLARNIRPAIAISESLNTMLTAWGVPAPNIADTIARAYEQSLLYGEHTWGGAQYWVTKYGAGTKWSYGDGWKADHQAGRFQRLEDSWAEHTAYIQKTDSLISPLLAGELDSLARSTQPDGWRITVFNPLPWKRGGLVSVRAEKPGLAALRPFDGGEAIPIWSVGESLTFLAPAIPAMGYRTFVPVKAELKAPDLRVDRNTATMESPFFKAAIDGGRGAVKSLVDKRTGRELVDHAAGQDLGQYLYERFDSNNVADYVKAYVKIKADWAINELGKPNMPPVDQVKYEAASLMSGSVRFRATPLCVDASMSVNVEGPQPHRVLSNLRLYADQPYADLQVTVVQKPADPWPEAGWLCLPFKVASPTFRLGRLGSVIDPATEIVRGANRNLFTINTGVTIFDPQGRGVGFCAIDNPLLSLDTPGCWKYSLDFVPKRPTAYINLFNNQWTTNFRLWNEGVWTSRVRLWAFDKYDAESSLITPSLEARWPLQAALADRPGGKLPATQTGLEVSRKGALVTAFGPNPDGPGTLLRLWELAGQPETCVVRLPDAMKATQVQPVDLRGRPVGEAIPVKQGAFDPKLRAFAPASFVIQK